MIVLILLGYILLGIYEFLPLYKQKLWTDLWANAVLAVASLVIAVLLAQGVKIPSPEAPIRKLIISLFGK